MDRYEKALALWRRKQVKTDAELAEALNGTTTRVRSSIMMV